MMTRIARRTLLAAALAAMPSFALAQGQTPLKIGTALDFTAVDTFVTAEYSQGQRDYAALINARGGIKGQPVEILVSDTGNQPQRGIEAYERLKGEGAVLVDMLSTPVSRAVAPRSLADGVNLITLFHGRSDAIDGQAFPTIFPLTANYWSQAATLVDYLQKKSGGSLKGKKIALVAIDSPFGKEPVPVFDELAKRLGFEFTAYPYASPGNEQSAVWTQVRRARPDFTLIWGAGGGQTVSVSTAQRNGMPMDQIGSVVWMAETDMKIVGPDQTKGMMRFEGVAPGRDLAVIKAIESEVISKGKGSGPAERVGSTYYNLGVASMAIVLEGARLAAEKDGVPVTAAKLKTGLESIKDYTADGLLPPTTITAKDHGGGSRGRISMWDGSKWVAQSDWSAPYSDIVWDLVGKSVAEFKASGK